ncbi:hypothetical protein OAF56_04855 [Pirellulaceae bacterium]|nr:hypothetical protein [Pirellulaceae bacterium]
MLHFDLVLDQGELLGKSCMLQFGDSNLVFEESTVVDLNDPATCFYGKLRFFVNGIQSVFNQICDFSDMLRDSTENGTCEFSILDCNGIQLVFTEVIPVVDCE